VGLVISLHISAAAYKTIPNEDELGPIRIRSPRQKVNIHWDGFLELSPTLHVIGINLGIRKRNDMYTCLLKNF